MKQIRFLLGCFLVIGMAGCADTGEMDTEPVYPFQAVEMIAPAGTGSGYDITIRSVVQCLKSTGKVIVPLPVTNKPGGGGRIALEYLDSVSGRDDVIPIFSPPLCLINLNGSTDLNYLENTTPIVQLVVDYGCFAVRSDSPLQNLAQLLDYLGSNPGEIVIGGTSAIGSMDHIQVLKVARAAGMDNLKDIRYESFENGGAVTQLMGGRIDVLSTGISDVVGLVESGDVRVLAVTSGERLEGKIISQMPTCREQGIDAEFVTWRGLFGPADMPDYAIEYWESVMYQMSDSKEWQAICKKYGWTIEYKNQEQFLEFLEEVNEEYKSLLEDVGLTQ